MSDSKFFKVIRAKYETTVPKMFRIFQVSILIESKRLDKIMVFLSWKFVLRFSHICLIAYKPSISKE